MFAQAKLADLENRVKPDEPRQRETGVAESTSRNLGHRAGRITNPLTSTTSTARCGPACRVVWEGSASLLAAPIPIFAGLLPSASPDFKDNVGLRPSV